MEGHYDLIKGGNIYIDLYKKTRSKIGKKGAIANIRIVLQQLVKDQQHAIIYQGRLMLVRDILDETYVEFVHKQLLALKRLKLFLQDDAVEMHVRNLAECYVDDIERYLKKQGFIFDDERIIGWTALEGEDNE